MNSNDIIAMARSINDVQRTGYNEGYKAGYRAAMQEMKEILNKDKEVESGKAH